MAAATFPAATDASRSLARLGESRDNRAGFGADAMDLLAVHIGRLHIEQAMLLAAVFLGIVHIVLAAQLANYERGLAYAATSRDEIKPPLSGAAGRAERALRNYLETFTFFAAVVMLAHSTGVHTLVTVWGSIAYIFGRAVYLPLYLSGVPLIRSLFWNIATFGIMAIGVAQFWS
jgi:uncharacterized MAPEG superfamily protein